MTPDAVSKSDLRRNGFSVDRLSIANIDNMDAYANDRAAREDWTVAGICISVCKEVRDAQQRDPVRRSFCVIDTATKDNSAHADILRAKGKQNNNGTKWPDIRADLSNLFGVRRPIKGAVLEVFASKKGSWTFLITMPNGLTCVVASGQSWETLAPVQNWLPS